MTLMDEPCLDSTSHKVLLLNPARWDRPPVSVVIPVRAISDAASTLERLPRVDGEVILVATRPARPPVAPEPALRPGVPVARGTVPCDRAVLGTGFAAARGDCIVVFDGAASIDAGDIERFVEALRAGCRSVHHSSS
jgi:hypothetical protein